MGAVPGVRWRQARSAPGFGAGVGIAPGAKLSGQEITTFVMVGDGGCNEGPVRKSAHVVAPYQLNNPVVTSSMDLEGR